MHPYFVPGFKPCALSCIQSIYEMSRFGNFTIILTPVDIQLLYSGQKLFTDGLHDSLFHHFFNRFFVTHFHIHHGLHFLELIIRQAGAHFFHCL